MLMLVVLTLTVALTAVAQDTAVTYVIKGLVADSLTLEGEPYATLTIVRAGDREKPVKMAVTDRDGKFSITATGEGDYLLRVKAVGRVERERAYTVTAGSRVIDLGTIAMTDSRTELAGVEVVAYKPLVKADMDKIAYSVEDDPESKSSMVIEMLKKVPLVTVDGEDNIKVNGSASFKIYVNGKPNSMMNRNPKDVLRSMPAMSIKKIEVITNPGAKYDAEGVGGILNIITTGSGPEGYTATFSLRASLPAGAGGGVYATAKRGKFTVSANVSANRQKNRDSYNLNDKLQLGADGAPVSGVSSDMSSTSSNRWTGGNIEMSYEIDTLRLITASVAIGRPGYDGHNRDAMRSYELPAGSDLYSYNIRSDNPYRGRYIEGGVDYQRAFRTKERLLTLSYRIEDGVSHDDYLTRYLDRQAGDGWADYLDHLKDQYVSGEGRTTEHTFQADYTTPFAKYHTFETGAKYILRVNTPIYDRYEPAGDDGSGAVYDPDNSSYYRHRHGIAAVYAGYGLSLKKWTARLGLRYERTEQKVDYRRGRGADFDKSFNDLVPTVRLGYKLGDQRDISISYKIRISRPGIDNLNPYIDDSDIEFVQQGNPNLVSEKSHSLELRLSDYLPKFNYNVAAGYCFVNNSIEHVFRQVNDRDIEGLANPTGRDVIYSTYYNIGCNRYVNFSGNAGWTPLRDTRVNLNVWGGYRYYSDERSPSAHRWVMSLSGSVQQTIARTWTVSLWAYKQTPDVGMQRMSSGYFTCNVSVSKSMLDKRLNITVYASNPFQKYFSYNTDLLIDGLRTTTRSRWSQRRFGLSLSYRIGQLKDSVRHASRSVSNDDVKQGTSRGGAQ